MPQAKVKWCANEKFSYIDKPADGVYNGGRKSEGNDFYAAFYICRNLFEAVFTKGDGGYVKGRRLYGVGFCFF